MSSSTNNIDNKIYLDELYQKIGEKFIDVMFDNFKKDAKRDKVKDGKYTIDYEQLVSCALLAVMQVVRIQQSTTPIKLSGDDVLDMVNKYNQYILTDFVSKNLAFPIHQDMV